MSDRLKPGTWIHIEAWNAHLVHTKGHVFESLEEAQSAARLRVEKYRQTRVGCANKKGAKITIFVCRLDDIIEERKLEPHERSPRKKYLGPVKKEKKDASN